MEQPRKRNLPEKILAFTARMQRVHQPQEGEIIYGDMTTRLFALMIDFIIILFPVALVSSIIMVLVFGVGDQYAVTVSKIMPEHPQLIYDPVSLYGYIARTYPADFDIILRQFIVNKIIWAVVFGIYNIFFIYRYGATPAKMIFGLRVVDNITGGKLSLSQTIIRYLAYFVSFPFGIIWGGTRHDKRCWHDFLADTAVIFAPDRWYKRKTEGIRGHISKFLNSKPRLIKPKDKK